jgi:hypothetical protein
MAGRAAGYTLVVVFHFSNKYHDGSTMLVNKNYMKWSNHPSQYILSPNYKFIRLMEQR